MQNHFINHASYLIRLLLNETCYYLQLCNNLKDSTLAVILATTVTLFITHTVLQCIQLELKQYRHSSIYAVNVGT